MEQVDGLALMLPTKDCSEPNACSSNLPAEAAVDAYTNLEIIPRGSENGISLKYTECKDLNNEEKYVALTLKNLTITSSLFIIRVSFIFDIGGIKNDYRCPCMKGTYYESIDSSSRIINLGNLISFRDYSFVLLKVVILVQEYSTVDPLEFKINRAE